MSQNINNGSAEELSAENKSTAYSLSKVKSMSQEFALRKNNAHTPRITRKNSMTASIGQTSVDRLSRTSSVERVDSVKAEVEEVLGIMNANIDKTVRRGESLEALKERTEILVAGATGFFTLMQLLTLLQRK